MRRSERRFSASSQSSMIKSRLPVHLVTDAEITGGDRVNKQLTLRDRSPGDSVCSWLPVFLALCALDISPASSQSIDGTILRPRFVSAYTNKIVRFNIYLPAAYEDRTDRYPVIYQLHGRGGNQSSNNRTIASHVDRALAAGLLPPVIVVFPDGQRDSWWADSKNGRITAETDVIREVIPYVDANYRTKATRSFRAVQGFSMGGTGAIEYALKFPELFSVSVSYDGGFQTWEGLSQDQREAAREMFSMDEAYFSRYSPWSNAARYLETAHDYPVAFRIVAGQLPTNAPFANHLGQLGIPVSYEQTNCDHRLSCLSQHNDFKSYHFIGYYFGE